jgi:molybdenum cofactor cytidylyltransferase
MGRPKMLLPWGKSSILGHLINQWRTLGAEQIGVVHAADDTELKRELDHLSVPNADRIVNAAPQRGMFSSIQCAARWPGWATGMTHWAIVLGDQPQIGRETLQAIITFSSAHPDEICVPKHRGHRRHPVIMPEKAFVQLAHSNAADLKSFLDAPPRPAIFCELDDSALELDIDTPEDYQRITEIYGRLS